MRTTLTAIAAAAVAVGWAVSGGPVVAMASADPPAPPQPRTTIDHDGTYAVGTDITPGIYSSAGPAGKGACYWKRLGDADNKVIDNAMSKKPQVVQIEASDKAFKTDGCQPWQKTDTATPDPGTPPGDVKLQMDILNGLLNHQPASPPPAP